MEPGVLAGKTQLQHLDIWGVIIGGAAGQAQLLSQLQALTQLTHLRLTYSTSPDDDGDDTPPAAAFAALTASSKLQHLDIQDCVVP